MRVEREGDKGPKAFCPGWCLQPGQKAHVPPAGPVSRWTRDKWPVTKACSVVVLPIYGAALLASPVAPTYNCHAVIRSTVGNGRAHSENSIFGPIPVLSYAISTQENCIPINQQGVQANTCIAINFFYSNFNGMVKQPGLCHCLVYV